MDKNQLVREIKTLRKTGKYVDKLEYDLLRTDFLLGECIIFLEKMQKRANSKGDSLMAVESEELRLQILKTLNKVRYGVDIEIKRNK